MTAILIFLFAALVNPFNLDFQHYTTRDGLPTNKVGTVCRDSTGYLWAGTTSGLCRFDGYQFKTYQHNPADSFSLHSNIIKFLYIDKNERLWVGTSKGVAYYTPDNDHFVRVHDLTIGGHFQLSDSSLLIGTEDKRIFKLDCSNQSVTSFFQPDIATGGQIINNPIQIDSTVIFGVQNYGLFVHQINKDTTIAIHSTALNIHNNQQHFMHLDNQGTLWLGGDHQMQRLFMRDAPLGVMPAKIIKNGQGAIAECADSTICFGTQTGFGLYSKTNEQFTPVTLPDFNKGTCFLFDGTSLADLWIATDRGLYHATVEQKFKTHHSLKNHHLLDKDVWSLYQADSLLWIAAEHHLYIHNQKQNTLTTVPLDLIHYDQIRAIQPADSGKMWLLDQHRGLLLYNPKTLKIEFALDDIIEENNRATFYTMHRQAESIYLGMNSKGLGIFHIPTRKFSYVDFAAFQLKIPPWVMSIEPGTLDNQLLLGLWENGLWEYNTKRATLYPIKLDGDFDISNTTVLDIMQYRHNKYFLATDGQGLFVVENDKISKQFTKEHGLSSNIIYHVQKDKLDRIWCATSYGLNLFYPDKQLFKTFYQKDGLAGNEFNLGAGFQNQNGHIYLGGEKGFTHFDPIETLDREPPKLILSQLKIFGDVVPLEHYLKKGKLLFNWHEHFITLGFTALHFKNPQHNQYTYRIGKNGEWTSMSQNGELTFPQQKPDSFDIFVKAANADGVWTDEPFKITLSIRPPLWNRIEFYIFVMLIIVAMIRIYHRYQIQRALFLQELKFKERDETRQKLAHNFHDDIGGMFSDLLWKCKILEKRLDAHPQEAKRVSAIIQYADKCYTEMRHFLWQINPEKDTLYELASQITTMISNRLPEHIAFTIKGVSPDLENIFLSMNWRREIFYIFKEATNNTLKYAHAYRLILSVTVGNPTFSITLQDNGQGFTLDQYTHGNGLKNMQSRAKSLGGILSVKSEPEKGTSITFTADLPKIGVSKNS